MSATSARPQLQPVAAQEAADPALKVLAEDAAHEARMHAVLVSIQQELSAPSLTDQELLQRAVSAALHATSGVGASLELLENGGLRCVAAAGQPPRGAGHWVATDAHPAWRVLAAGQALRNNGSQEAGWPPAPGPPEMPARPQLAVPLRRDAAIVGAITVWSDAGYAFAERDLAHLEILGESVGALLKLRDVAAQLQLSQSQYEGLFQTHPQPM